MRACCGGLDPSFDLTGSIRFASAILFRLSGRQFPGPCEREMWPPCCNSCRGTNEFAMRPASGWNVQSGSYLPSIPHRSGDGWDNSWNASGDCAGLPCVELPGPILSITEVMIGGVVLDPAAYVIGDNDRGICRVDGLRWPCGNRVGDYVRGWSVSYTTGKALPEDAVDVASIFACQIALARCGSDACTLPARLKEIVREGATMAFADPLEFISKGEVGIYEVDMWINSVNPHKRARRSSVYRADAPRGPRRIS